MNFICFDIETTGLDPIKDRITAIGVKNCYREEALIDKDEKFILEEFWKMIAKKYPYFRLVGFNCLSFDMPFILIRSFKHGVKVFDVRGKVIDLRFVLSHGNRYQQGKLEDYATLIGLDTKYNGYDGADAIKLWKNKQLMELEKYVLSDVQITYGIYKRVKEVGLL